MTFIHIFDPTPATVRFEDEGAVNSRTPVQRITVFLAELVRPSRYWHRLNEHMLRDIGKTTADAEFEEFTISLGSSVRSSISNSREGRSL